MTTTLDNIRNAKGELPSYAWPGGYPVIYFCCDGSVVCPDCANREVDQSQEPEEYDIHWEGEPIYCDGCSKPIESAYGPVDA